MITSFGMRLLTIAMLVAVIAGRASAAVIVVNLDTSVGGSIPGPAPYATARFTLNPDNTIGVDVTARTGLLITWFAFNKPDDATSTGITPPAVYTGTQITSGFADANDGVCLAGVCFSDFLTDDFLGESAPFGTPDLSFTLSRAGGFAGLSDLINTSTPDTCLCTTNDTVGVILTDDRPSDSPNPTKYAAVGTATVPEPSGILLFLSALGISAATTKLRRSRGL